MATIDFAELARRLREAATGLPQFGDEMASKLGLNAINDVKQRIITKGHGADNKPLKRADTSGGVPGFGLGMTDDYSKEYKARKVKAGRYRGHIDLQFTTRMWSNTGITEKRVSGNKWSVVIAAKTEENQVKLDANSDRYGDVLRQSEEEVTSLELDYLEEVDLYIQSYLDR